MKPPRAWAEPTPMRLSAIFWPGSQWRRNAGSSLLFRVSPLGSANPSPRGDWDATLRVCKMRGRVARRFGTASLTECGSRSYRFPVLGGDVGQRARELPREIARAHEMIIHAGSINRDHVHMPIGNPPHLSVSRAAQFLKGKSSHKLLSEFQSLRKRYWGQHLWGRGDWVATSGNVTDEVWKKDIEACLSG